MTGKCRAVATPPPMLTDRDHRARVLEAAGAERGLEIESERSES